MQQFNLICKKILDAKSIVIAGHINPDADSIGCLLALGIGLEKLGKNVYMLIQERIPTRFISLPGIHRLVRQVKIKPDLAIAVDCSNREILGRAFRIFKKSKDILEIDHHEFRRGFGNIKLIDKDAAAVGELIYTLLIKLDVEIDKNIAQNILTSIIVETNSFRLPGVRVETFEICAELLKRGVNFYKLVDTVFWSQTRQASILSGICLARCKFMYGGKLAWTIIKNEDLKRLKGRKEDVDGVADQIRAIKGVEIVIFFREVNNKILRVSLRSKSKINIASVAESFNGGGHFDVAGCHIPNTSEAMKTLIDRARKLLRW
ncbi:MAG: bifunctional oligoribonuclease/PAP phosphatase NrnA [Candidatus Omnitrophota bacterium]